MMPIYLLGERSRSVEIPNEPMSVALAGAGGGSAELRVVSAESQAIMRIDAQAVVIPSLTEPSTVGVAPTGDTTFENGMIVQLVIGPDRTGRSLETDPVQVTFDPVDVSGCRFAELATLTPRGNRIEVTALASSDAMLGSLAGMARAAARRDPGTRRRPPGGQLSIGIDTSASMWWSFHDGSVAAAIDLVVGVADAVEIRDVTAIMVGEECTFVSAPAAQLGETVSATPVRWSAGARWSRMPRTEHTLLVTDSVSHLAQQQLPMMLISADPRHAELGARLPPPPAGIGAQQHLLDSPAAIDEIVCDLLRVLT